ncbi:MAG: TRAP transporter small permease [Myxococcota bacterium]|nr:TRAP transporter small permease [Myxococcota bacterium]
MSNESDGPGGAPGGTGDAKARAGAPASDTDSSDARIVKEELSVPPTRQVSAALEPAVRPSESSLLATPERFPDDGRFAGTLRRIDHHAGQLEQVTVVALLAVIVLVGVVQAAATKIFQHSFLWSFEVVRAGTFAIAMAGAAFASHQARHLSMDLVSRKVGPRRRLGLRIVMGLFTIFATSLLFYSGYHLTSRLAVEPGSHTVPPYLIALMIPVGSALIILHTLLHLLIDADYLRRGKLPPAPIVTGH